MDAERSGYERDVERQPGDAAGWLRLARVHARAGAAEDALEAARRALAIDPALDEARALLRQAYVEVARDLEPPGLREAIGRALGRDGPWTEPPEWTEARLLGGSIHAPSGAVAWVEDLERERPGSAWVDCQVTLHVARGGREVLRWPLAHDNPYAGTTLHHVHVDGERVTLVYAEKRSTLAATVPLAGAPAIVEVAEAHRVLGDQVVIASEERGLLEVRRLPDLAPALPLPVRGPVDVHEPGSLRFERGALVAREPAPGPGAAPAEHVVPAPPGPPTPLLDLAQARALALAGPLAGAPQPEADLLLGAACHAFWLDAREVTAGYARAPRGWRSPVWLPLDWARAGRDEGRLAPLLDRLVAAPAPPDDDPAPAARLARHLSWRAAELRDALRAGHLPPGASCFLWERWSLEAFTPWLERFPPGFVEAFEALRATSPAPFPRAPG